MGGAVETSHSLLRAETPKQNFRAHSLGHLPPRHCWGCSGGNERQSSSPPDGSTRQSIFRPAVRRRRSANSIQSSYLSNYRIQSGEPFAFANGDLRV